MQSTRVGLLGVGTGVWASVLAVSPDVPNMQRYAER